MDDVRSAYGNQAALYVDLFGSTDAMHPDDLAFIDAHLSIADGSVLDVGCGPGHLTEHLRVSGCDAWGIDLVPEFVDHARTTYPLGRYDLGSMTELAIPDQSLGGILAWYSLIHVTPTEVDDLLRRLRRSLLPGGTIVVGFFDGEHVEAFAHKVMTAWFWPAAELSARLRDAGFVEIDRLLRPAKEGRRAHGAIAAAASTA